MRRWWRLTTEIVLLLLGTAELVVAVIGLPRVANATQFYDVGSLVRFFIYVLAGGLLPFGFWKVLQRRPVGWVWMVLANILWFSWAGASIDFFQELLGVIQ